MALELVPAAAGEIPVLSRICHEAFSALHDRFGIERDIPDVAVGEMIISQVVKRPDYTGVMAVLDGRVVGSNFLLQADEVAGGRADHGRSGGPVEGHRPRLDAVGDR